jgi:tape measure domain-containing protein
MDVSRLGIVVESTGITEATTALAGRNGQGGLAGAADKAEKNVGKLTSSLSNLLNLQASATTAAWTQALGGLNSVLANVNSNALATANSLQQAVASLNALAGASVNAQRATERHSSSNTVMTSTIKAMTTAFSVYTALNFAGSIVKQADEWQMMTARLENATGSMNNAKVAQAQMYDLSQRLRVPLEDSVKLYTRLAPSMQRMGKDSEYARKMVEGIATALQLGGANGAEASSVMLQLSQSFSSGVLNGAEFNAVAENGSVLMRALEKYTGKSTAELKKMGSTGKLSMELVGKAIEENLPQWREQFDKMPLTFEGGVQRIKNAWTKAIGEMGQDTGFNNELSKSLRVIEEMIPAVARGLGDAFISVMRWVQENKNTIGEIWDQIVGLGKDVWNIGGMLGNWIGAIIGAGEGFSLIGAALFTVRMLIAGAIDLLKVAGWVVAKIGISIVELVVAPFTWLLSAIGMVGDALKSLFSGLASGAKAVGADKLAGGFEAASNVIGDITTDVKDFNGNVIASFGKAHEVADSWVKDLKAGNGELDKLMKGNDKLATAPVTPTLTMDPAKWNANPHPKVAEDAKAAKAAETATKKFNDELDALNAKLKEQDELRQRLAAHGLDYDKVGPAQKKVIELEEHLQRLQSQKVDAATTLAISRQNELIAIAKKTSAIEVDNERTLETLKIEKARQDQQNSKLKSLEDEAKALEYKVQTYGMAKGAIEELEAAETRQQIAAMLNAGPLSQAEQKIVETLQAQLAVRERIAAASGKLGSLQVEEEFNKLMDPKRAEKFGDALANGMGKGLKAVDALVNAFDKYEARMSTVKKAWELVNKETDPDKKAKMMKEAAEFEAEARIKSYGDMAGAAKGYFAEGSRGYKALEAAEKTFRAFEIAMSIKSFVEKSGLLEAFTSLFVTSKATETAAEVASVGPHVAAEGTKQGANAITALTSALAAPFPANIPAFAMVAAMLAAIGVAVGGGSGGSVDQGNAGTGTVLGGSGAASKSIENSISALEEVDTTTMRYSSQMAASLRSIDASMGGLANLVSRGVGVDPGQAGIDVGFERSGLGNALASAGHFLDKIQGLDKITGGLSSWAVNKVANLFGTKTSVQGQGLYGSAQSLDSIMTRGYNAQVYADIEKKKKTLGITTSTSNETIYGQAGAETSDQFTKIFRGFHDAVSSAGQALGMPLGDIENRLRGFVVDIGKIKLDGLSAEQIKEKLSAVFSAAGDRIAKAAIPGLDDFQKVGEGYLETLVRVASGVETAKFQLEKLGIAAVDFSTIINKQGDVATEIVRQSILKQESELKDFMTVRILGHVFKFQTQVANGIGEIINDFSGSVEDMVALYKDLVSARDKLDAVGLGTDLNRDLIRAAGGLQELIDALDAYSEGFFSEAERNASKLSKLRIEFAKLGVEMPITKDGFRSLIDQLNASGAEGEALAIKVLTLSGAFAELADSADAAVSAARDKLRTAYDNEAGSITNLRDKFLDFSKSLGDFKSSLITGDMSPLSGTEKYLTELERYDDVSKRAQAGDETAISNFESVATEFLKMSRDMFASGEQYTADFNRVLAETAALESSTAGQATVQQQSLDALNKQVDGLITINESVLTVTQAIEELRAVMSMGVVASTINGSHANGLSYVPFDGYVAELHQGEAVLTASENKAYQMDYAQYGLKSDEALVSEIKALRQEVQNLREGQREQTGQLIAANYDAQERNAQAVVEGTMDAVGANSYAERAKVTLS